MQTLTLKRFAVGLIASLTLAGATYAQMGQRNGMPGMGGMMGGGQMKDMMPIHSLLMNHTQITRTVQDIPGGVRTVTTSKDPQLVQTLRTHVWAMKKRVTQDQPIRQRDPLFRQLFLHFHEINLQVLDVPGGVQTTETSKNPQVTMLIRQHARRAVSEFVKYGMPRAMQATPLPKGYHPLGGKDVNGTQGNGTQGSGMMGM